MSRYILDSHILIWWLADAPELTIESKLIIENADNEIYISAASVWEISIKQKMGKLYVSDNLLQIIADSGFNLLSMTAKHAEYAAKLPMHHRDPFDRMLIAQASIEEVCLISHDSIFKNYLPFPLLEV